MGTNVYSFAHRPVQVLGLSRHRILLGPGAQDLGGEFQGSYFLYVKNARRVVMVKTML